MLADDPWMAHSLLSSSLNLGLLDPLDVVQRAEQAYREADLPLASVEGLVRQVIGWRDYIWNLYWHLGPDYRHRNALHANEDIPDWFAELDADAVQARCLSSILADVRDHAWVHHIPRLMVLGNYAMQRGWDPAQVTDWFHRAFVDGYDWVMVPNVVGMSQYADGGQITTKPYAGGGAYINRMSDYCGGCAYSPTVRVGEKACPFTAGYWSFLDRHRAEFAGNHRMAQAVRGLDRLKDLELLVLQERDRGSAHPDGRVRIRWVRSTLINVCGHFMLWGNLKWPRPLINGWHSQGAFFDPTNLVPSSSMTTQLIFRSLTSDQSRRQRIDVGEGQSCRGVERQAGVVGEAGQADRRRNVLPFRVRRIRWQRDRCWAAGNAASSRYISASCGGRTVAWPRRRSAVG